MIDHTINKERFFCSGLFSFVLTFTILLFSINQAHAERLLVGGTGSSLGSMKLLAIAFMKKYPDHKVIILPSLGSGGGIKALADRKIQISLSSRPLKDKERKRHLTQTKYVETPFIIATNQNNGTSQLTIKQLARHYSGKITHWPNGTPIRIIKRPPYESDNAILKSMSAEMNDSINIVLKDTHLAEAFNDQQNAKALEHTPGSLGTMTLGQMLSEKRVLKEIKIKGIKGSIKNIKNGNYSYIKSLYIILPEQPVLLAKTFIQFVFSIEGKSILTGHGYIVVADKAF